MSDPRYKTARWQKLRKAHLHTKPFCAMCEADGHLTVGKHVDHVVPHKGNEGLFWNGALQTLCTPHHNATKQRDENREFSSGVDAAGIPKDPHHPFNR